MADDPKVKALFNAARRYCTDRSDQIVAMHKPGVWDAQDEELSGEQGLFVATLREIELALPKDFNNELEVREYLSAAANKARERGGMSISGTGPDMNVTHFAHEWSDEERTGWEKAKAEYLAYIANVTVAQAAQTEPVLYRHAMSDSKRRRVRKNLAERWNADPTEHYWYPLMDDELPQDVIAFQYEWYYVELGVRTLQRLLLSRGIKQVWEIHEFGLADYEYELDPRLCHFSSGDECYWSSRELDWLIYESHESSITFAGYWLIDAVKKAWPNWEQRIYTDWDFVRPDPADLRKAAQDSLGIPFK